MKGQTSIEFLMMSALAIGLFMIAMLIYYINVEEAAAVSDTLAATQVCLKVATAINSISAMRGNTTYVFDLPQTANNKEYAMWVSGVGKAVKVDLGSVSVGCSLNAANVTNSNGSSLFNISKNSTVTGIDGAITIVQ